MTDRIKVLIMGAGGRDFHDFNVVFRDDPAARGRRLHRDPDPRHRRPPLPARARRPALSRRHPDPRPSRELEAPDRREHGSTEVVFAYSDVPHEYVMHAGARGATPPAPTSASSARTRR